MAYAEDDFCFKDPPLETGKMKRIISIYIERVKRGDNLVMLADLYDYFHVYYRSVSEFSDLVKEANDRKIFEKLNQVTYQIDRDYETIVRDEYEKSPLRWMDLPGDHVYLGLFARYFANITSTPFHFHQYLMTLVNKENEFDGSLIDKEYDLPYVMRSKGKEWNDTLLFPHGFGIGQSYYNTPMNQNIKYLDIALNILKTNSVVRKHLVRNIIKGRFIVRKFAKNEEVNKLITKYLEYRNNIVNEFYRVRERIATSQQPHVLMNNLSQVLGRVTLRITNNKKEVTQETYSILGNISNFFNGKTSLDESLLLQYPGLYNSYIVQIENEIFF